MCFLVAIDLTAPSRSAIELSARLARVTGLSPLLLHVSEGHPPLRLLADLYDLAAPLRAHGGTPRLRTVQGDAAASICEQARIRQARFVVMGTHGRRGDADSDTGSVASAVMAGCDVPVIAVRPQRDGAGAADVIVSTNPNVDAPTWVEALLQDPSTPVVLHAREPVSEHTALG